jgi:hypothetical protein
MRLSNIVVLIFTSVACARVIPAFLSSTQTGTVEERRFLNEPVVERGDVRG